MSVTTRNPLRTAGANLNSGNVNTGQLPNTQGGGRNYSAGSGVAVDTLIFSGAGRLDVVVQTTQLASGRGVVFYDGNIATSGGPFTTSGHVVLAVIQPTFSPAVWSGTVPRADWSDPRYPAAPFFSGLIAAPKPDSGTCSFALSFTPETNQNQ